MYIKKIDIGDKLALLELLETEETKKLKYTSRVEHIFDKNRLSIYMPILFGNLVKLDIGKLYSLIFYTDDGLIEFQGKVLSHRKEYGFNMTDIELVDEGKLDERREFYRFTCLIDSFFSFNQVKLNEENEIKFKGIIKDISCGGIKFTSNYKIDEKSITEIYFKINKESISVKGKVLHRQVTLFDDYKYQYRIKFLDIEEISRCRIMNFISDQQSKLLKNLI